MDQRSNNTLRIFNTVGDPFDVAKLRESQIEPLTARNLNDRLHSWCECHKCLQNAIG